MNEREYTVIDTLMHRHVVTYPKLRAVIVSSNMVLFFSLVLCILLVSDPEFFRLVTSDSANPASNSNFPNDRSAEAFRLLMWPANIAIYVLMYLTAHRWVSRTSIRSFYAPVLTAPVYAIAFGISYLISYFLFDPEVLFRNWSFEALYALITILIETVFLRIFFSSKEDKPDEKKTDGKIVAGQYVIPWNTLTFMKSEDHFVVFKTVDTSITIRGKLSEFVHLADPNGIQPHRSWWIAPHALANDMIDPSAKSLTLKDGTSVPIARKRADDVKRWLSVRSQAA